MSMATLFNLTVANIDPNGRITTREQFEYINKNGLRMYGSKLTLAIENGATIVNGLDVQSTLDKYLKSLED